MAEARRIRRSQTRGPLQFPRGESRGPLSPSHSPVRRPSHTGAADCAAWRSCPRNRSVAGELPANKSREKHEACFSLSAATLAGIFRAAGRVVSPTTAMNPTIPTGPSSPASGANAMSHHCVPVFAPGAGRRAVSDLPGLQPRVWEQVPRPAACCVAARNRPSRAHRRASRRSASPMPHSRTAADAPCRARTRAWRTAERTPATETSPTRAAGPSSVTEYLAWRNLERGDDLILQHAISRT